MSGLKTHRLHRYSARVLRQCQSDQLVGQSGVQVASDQASMLMYVGILCHKNWAVKAGYFNRLDKVDFNFQLTVRLINYLRFKASNPIFFNSFPLFFVLAAPLPPSNAIRDLSRMGCRPERTFSFVLLQFWAQRAVCYLCFDSLTTSFAATYPLE